MMFLTVLPKPHLEGLPPVNRRAVDRLTAVNSALETIRQAVSECGYTMEALAAETGKSRQYVHAVLSGQKPMSLAFLVLLPDDVHARLLELRGPIYGLIVVRPQTGSEAIKSLVSGLVGLLTGKAAA